MPPKHGFWDESFYIYLAGQALFNQRTRQVISNLLLNENYQHFYFRSIECNIIFTYLISVLKELRKKNVFSANWGNFHFLCIY